MKSFVRACCLIIVVGLVVSCAVVQSAPKGTDLTLTSLKVVAAKAIVEGSPFLFEFKIKNIGTEPLPEVQTAVKAIVPRIVVYQGDIPFAVSQPIPAMKAGEEITLQTEILNKDPKAQAAQLSLAKAGDYTFTAIIDPSGFISEVSKENNQKNLTLKVAPKPQEAKK